jgi:sulfonate transport system substrate-binding protein
MLSRRSFAAASLAAAALPLAARAASPQRIRIGMAMAGLGGRPYAMAGALSVVHVQKLLEAEFARDDIAIDWQFFAGAGPAVNEALANQALDFAWQGDLPAIVARSRGLGTKQLLVISNRLPIYAVVGKDSSIRTLADLKGKTVANFQGTTLQLVADRALATVGLSESGLNMINLDEITALEAVAQGQVDASFLITPPSPQAAQHVRVIFSSGPAQPVITAQSSFLVTEPFFAANPEIVQRVVRVIVTAAQWTSLPQNHAALLAIFAKTGFPPAIIEGIYGKADPLVASSPLWDPFQVAQLTRSAADAYRFGLIDHQVSTTQWIEPGPLNAALAALKLQNYWPSFSADGLTKLG